VVGSDSLTDVAVLKITAEGLRPAIIGDSSTLRVGDFTLAVGNPLGELNGTVSFGIISALNREIELDGGKRNVFQVDAAVNPGNSGGGLFDSNGALIGIVNAKKISGNAEGISFVLPINDVKPVAEDIIEFGYVKGRPSLGFTPVEISSMRTAQYYGLKWIGVYVNSVDEGSFAAECGFQFKDYIRAMDGEQIATIDRLNELLETKSVGDTAVLEVWRGDRILDVILKIGEDLG